MNSLQTCFGPTRRRNRRVAAGLLACLLLAGVFSLVLGPASLSPAEALAALLGRGDEIAFQIVRNFRLPRTLGCLLAGAALAVSGAIIQSVLANPLAAPNVIGVNAGAGLMVALCCALAPTAIAWVPVMAFLGALGGVLLVLAIARRTGASRLTLVLAGVAVTANAFPEDIAATTAAGMNAHVSKPIDFPLLCRTLASLLPKP